MGYRIEYAIRDGTLRAVVSGRASLHYASSIARDIAAEAAQAQIERLLIDLRGLHDRIGILGRLLEARGRRGRRRYRVAVVDVRQNDRYYVFAEEAARRAGARLRYFHDPEAAASWLLCRTD